MCSFTSAQSSVQAFPTSPKGRRLSSKPRRTRCAARPAQKTSSFSKLIYRSPAVILVMTRARDTGIQKRGTADVPAHALRVSRLVSRMYWNGRSGASSEMTGLFAVRGQAMAALARLCSGTSAARARFLAKFSNRETPMEHLQYPNESADYRAARNALLDDEIALRAQIEKVAAQRRALPPGGELKEDYVFERIGKTIMPEKVSLSELFGPHDTLILYSFMYGPE